MRASTNEPMKVIVLGAGGRLGSRVLAESVRAGHDTTAFVRSADRLQKAIGDDLVTRLAGVIQGDATDLEAVTAALRGQEAVFQAAGYIGSTPEEGQALHTLVATAVQAANEALVGPRRLWVLGGAGALDLPGRGVMMIDVPGFPMPKYRLHKRNFQLLCSTQFDSLDWSFACPGVMLDSPASSAQGGSGVQAASLPPPPPARVSVDELPFPLPGWAALLPTPLLLPALAAIKDRLVGPSYGEVAAAMVAHLAPGGPLRHRRVGFAAAGAAGTAAASESSSEDLGS